MERQGNPNEENKINDELFRIAFENSADPAFIVDKRGNFIYANKASYYLLGYTSKEFSSMNISDVVPEDGAINYRKHFGTLLKKGSIYTEIRMVRKEGNIVPTDLNAVILPNGLIYGSCRDISKRLLIEYELKEKEKQLDAIYNDPETFIGIVDTEGRLLSANNSALSFIHKSVEEIIGMKFWDTPWWTHSRQLQEKLRSGIKKAARGERVSFEADHTSAGNVVWVDFSIRPILEADGRINTMVVEGINITVRKLAETALKESEEKLRNIFENSTNLFYSHTPDHVLTFVSPQVEEILGYTPEEAMKRWTEFASDNPINELGFQSTMKAIETGKRQPTYELELIRKDGRKIWIEVRESPLVHNGKTTAIVGSLNDITDRKKAELQLLKSAKEWITTFDATNDAIWLMSKTHQILRANRASFEIFNLTEDEMKRLTCCNVVHGSDTPIDGCPMVKSKKSKKRESMELEINNKWFEVIVDPIIDDQEKFSGAVHIVRDITESKTYEQEILKAKEKAEESDMLKSAFLANMSHEIRTPMNGILGFAELLKEPDISGDEQAKYINIIERSGERMLNTINNLIDISKIESKQIEVNISSFDLIELLEELYNFFKHEAMNKGLEFKLLINHKDSLCVESDFVKLNSILTNLVKNAIKYTHSGYVEFGFNRNGDSLDFYVKDSGIGMSSEFQSTVFERFSRAETTPTSHYEGTGLGLSISKAYIEMLGGDIKFESKLNKGSSFYFSIPVKFC